MPCELYEHFNTHAMNNYEMRHDFYHISLHSFSTHTSKVVSDNDGCPASILFTT
jgi:hypothetical protein